MIFPPDQTVKPLRPEGNFGVQITVALDDGYKTLWLSGITTTQADIFRTPSDLRLGIPVGQMLDSLLQGTPIQGELPELVTSARVDRIELKKPVGEASFSFGLEISVTYSGSEVRFWLMLEKATVNGEASYGFALKIRLGDPHNPSIELDISLDGNGIFAHLEQPKTNPKSFNLAPLGRVLSPELEELMGAIEITPLELAIGSYKAIDDSDTSDDSEKANDSSIPENDPAKPATTNNKTTQKTARSYVLAFRLEGDVTLSQLPFIGERLPKNAKVGISDLSLVWCSAAIAEDEQARQYLIEKYNKAKQNPNNASLITGDSLTSGGLFSAQLQVPSETQQLSIPFKSLPKSAAPALPPAPLIENAASGGTETSLEKPKPAAPAAAASGDAAKWFEVNKNVGPLKLRRMGLKYQDKKVWFLFDTTLSAGAVILTVDGLGAGIDPFELLGGRFKPAFTLRGLGLTIKGPAEVSGAFLRERITDPRGDYDEFSGIVLIKTEAFTVSGMGSYADPPWGDPSFFAYAFLDKTIGGPPFFFVTGLALGIAVNRNLDLPPIDQVSQFPLVRLALGEPPTPPSSNLPAIRDTGGDTDLAKLLQVQQAMKPYTRPNSGQVVLAIGVRFTTFNLLNSFALLVASFGKPFKLDLLISSRLQIPAPPPGSESIPSIAQIGIDLRGTWIPAEGSLIIEGRITEGSWFLDSACRLSGGAAFASWTVGEHEGDFVMTVGGYHPKFLVPTHYPKVPRLAFNITRSPIEIKGDAYFAMTPSALMSGGSLSATYTEGRIKAWFNCSADFLVAWEPFHYEANLQVEVGTAYQTALGTIRASVGANLQLWGPDLAGIATIDLKVIKYDVKFGGDKKPIKPIEAKTFRDRFLPANNADLISIGVSKGLVRTGTHEGMPLFVVNPADFALAIESVIPKPDGKTIGIGPMGKVSLQENEILTWKVTKRDPRTNQNVKDEHDKDKDKDFATIDFRSGKDSPELLVKKPVPAALWGAAPREGAVRSANFSAEGTVIDAIVGYIVKPKNAPTSPENPPYPIKIFAANSDPSPQIPSFKFKNYRFAEDSSANKRTVEDIFNEINHVADAFPTDLLQSLTGEKERDFKSEVSLSTDWLADLQESPRVVTLEEAS